MNETATDITIEHYGRPEVKEAILKFCGVEDGSWRALNGDFRHWYCQGSDPKSVRLLTPKDYDSLTEQYRTIYATLDVFGHDLFERTETWDEVTGSPAHSLGTLEDCVAFNPGVDIDLIERDLDDKANIEALEDAAQFFCDYLRDHGIKRSVHALFSGGGAYVLVHHALFKAKPEWSREDRGEMYRILCIAFNRLIYEIADQFFQAYPQHRGKVKFDAVNNQKRLYKTVFSIHKSLPLVVVPLDPKRIKIDLNNAKLPLSEGVLAEGNRWYQDYDVKEKLPIQTLLQKYLDLAKVELEERREAHRTEDIFVSREPIPLDRFPPCLQNIIDNVGPGEGRHRALGVLAAFLGQAGWNMDESLELWMDAARKAGISDRIDVFYAWYGQMICPTCKRIQEEAAGYPVPGLGGLGYCVPDDRCKEIAWPLNYDRVKGLPPAEHNGGTIELETHRYTRDIGEYSFTFWRNKSEWSAQIEGEDYKSLVHTSKSPPWTNHKTWKTDLIRDIRTFLSEQDLKEYQRFRLEIQDHETDAHTAKETGEDEDTAGVKTSFIELAGGVLAEQVFDPDTKNSKFAVYDPGTDQVSYVPEVEFNGVKYVPISDDEGLLKGFIRLPKKAEEYGTNKELYDEVRDFIHRYLDVTEDYERIACFYPMLTWCYDVLDTINYLRSLGDWGSGKSRFLSVFSMICYKSISSTGAVTEAPVFRILEKWRGTLILDEADFDKSSESAGIVKILNSGYERGKPVIRCDVNDPEKVHYFDPFGPKIIATRREFQDRALESRCFTEIMRETLRDDIPVELPHQFYVEGAQLRNKLLMFRFRNRRRIADRAAREPEFEFGNISTRLKQAARPLSLLVDDELKADLQRFLAVKNIEMVEKASESLEGHIVRVIVDHIGEPLHPGDIASELKEEFPNITAKTIGKRIRGLGLTTEPQQVDGKKVRLVVYTEAQLNKLKSRYIPNEKLEFDLKDRIDSEYESKSKTDKQNISDITYEENKPEMQSSINDMLDRVNEDGFESKLSVSNVRNDPNVRLTKKTGSGVLLEEEDEYNPKSKEKPQIDCIENHKSMKLGHGSGEDLNNVECSAVPVGLDNILTLDKKAREIYSKFGGMIPSLLAEKLEVSQEEAVTMLDRLVQHCGWRRTLTKANISNYHPPGPDDPKSGPRDIATPGPGVNMSGTERPHSDGPETSKEGGLGEPAPPHGIGEED